MPSLLVPFMKVAFTDATVVRFAHTIVFTNTSAFKTLGIVLLLTMFESTPSTRTSEDGGASIQTVCTLETTLWLSLNKTPSAPQVNFDEFNKDVYDGT